VFERRKMRICLRARVAVTNVGRRRNTVEGRRCPCAWLGDPFRSYEYRCVKSASCEPGIARYGQWHRGFSRWQVGLEALGLYLRYGRILLGLRWWWGRSWVPAWEC